MSCPKLAKYHTINFKTKNYDQILLETLQDSISNGLISEDENIIDYITENNNDIENQYVLQSSIHSRQIEKIYDEIQNIYDAQDINLAQGEDLNRIGEQLGFQRPSSTHSYVDLTFTLSNKAPNTIIIPQNTLISTKKNGGKNYRTNTRVKISQGNQKVTVPATSIDYGKKSRVKSGELKHIQHPPNNIPDDMFLSVTNNSESSGGKNLLTDDEYREVLRKWTTILEKGTRDAYTFYLDNLQGLESYKLIPLWDGAGTLKIVVSPNSQYLVDLITNDLYDNVQLFDDDVLVVGALEEPIDLDLIVNITLDTDTEYTSDEINNLENEIKELLTLYVEGGIYCNTEYVNGLGIGEDFIPYQAGRFLSEHIPSIRNIVFSDDNPISVDDESKAVIRAINVNIE